MDKDDIRVPYPIRVSPNERKVMYSRAQRLDVSVPELIRLLVLHDTVDAQITSLLDQKQQRDTGGKILAMLGRSQVPNNLTQIAKSLHCDSYEQNDVVVKTVDECLALLSAIRETQMQAQGLRKP